MLYYDIVAPIVDVIFIKLFTDHQDLLHDFISVILDIPSEKIKYIEIIDSRPLDYKTDTLSRFNLKLHTDEQVINVEIQLHYNPNYYDKMLLYWSNPYTYEHKNNKPRNKLNKTVSVNIIYDFKMFEGENYHTEIQTVIKETGEVFSDKFSIHFFELDKVGKKFDPNDRKALWMQFIKAESEYELEMIKDTKVPVMEKAANVIFEMSDDISIREWVRLREKSMHDEASLLYDAWRKGFAEGYAESYAKRCISDDYGKTFAEGYEKGLEIVDEYSKVADKLRRMGKTEEQIKQVLDS